MAVHEKDDKLLQFPLTKSNGWCLQFKVQMSIYSQTFSTFPGKENIIYCPFFVWVNITLKSFLFFASLISLGEVFFSFCVNAICIHHQAIKGDI